MGAHVWILSRHHLLILVSRVCLFEKTTIRHHRWHVDQHIIWCSTRLLLKIVTLSFFFLLLFSLEMYLIVLLCSCLIILTTLSLCANQIHELQASVLSYGKLNLHNTKKPKTRWAHYLSTLTVPKHYFNHFYIIGLLFGINCAIELYFQKGLVFYLLRQWDQPSGSHHLPQLQCQVGLLLVNFHLARRVYESLIIERPSKEARMHMSHYLTGVGFYGAMVLGTWLEGAVHLGVWPSKTIEKGIYMYIYYHV